VTVSRLYAYSSTSAEEYPEYPTAAAELLIILLPFSVRPKLPFSGGSKPTSRGETNWLPVTRPSS
jgi:hypothetical protein